MKISKFCSIFLQFQSIFNWLSTLIPRNSANDLVMREFHLNDKVSVYRNSFEVVNHREPLWLENHFFLPRNCCCGVLLYICSEKENRYHGSSRVKWVVYPFWECRIEVGNALFIYFFLSLKMYQLFFESARIRWETWRSFWEMRKQFWTIFPFGNARAKLGPFWECRDKMEVVFIFLQMPVQDERHVLFWERWNKMAGYVPLGMLE